MSKGTRITKRWIDAEGIMRACYNSFLTTGNKAYSEIISLVEAVPAADVAEVRHGRWIFKEDRRIVDGYDWQCNQCNSWQRYTSNYCPHCGAKMDEVTE